MKDIVVFYHLFLENDWKKILIEQVDKLIKHELDKYSNIKICGVYNHFKEENEKDLKSILNKLNNYEIILYGINDSSGEGQTIKKIKEYCDNLEKNQKILYFHSKGISQQFSVREKPCDEWRRMMEYFLIEKWQECVKKLEDCYDCCGINYQPHSGRINGQNQLVKIFNGNFFWVNSDYVKKIDKNFLFESRYSAENWVLSIEHKAFSFFDTPTNFDLYYNVFENYK